MKRQQQQNDSQHGGTPSKKAEKPKTAIRDLASGFILDTMSKMSSEAVNDVRAASRDFDQVFLNHQDQFPAPTYTEEDHYLELKQERANSDEMWTWKGTITRKTGDPIIVHNVSLAWIKNHLKGTNHLMIGVHGPLPNFFGGKTDLSQEEAKAVEAEMAEKDDEKKMKVKKDWERLKAISTRRDEGAFEKMKTFLAEECNKLESVSFLNWEIRDPIENVISMFGTRSFRVVIDDHFLEYQNLSVVIPKLVGVSSTETLDRESIRNILNYTNLLDASFFSSEFVETQVYMDQWKNGLREIYGYFLKMPYDGPDQTIFENRDDGNQLKIESIVLRNGMHQFHIREV